MEKTTLYLPPALRRALKELARREGRSQAEVIREALAAYLEKKSRPVPKSLGLGEDENLAGKDAEAWLERAWEAE